MIATTTLDSRVGIALTGVVQGVGFRPFICRLANLLGLNGFVANRGGAVEIEVQGRAERIEEFLLLIRKDAPPGAIIDGMEARSLPLSVDAPAGFFIARSLQYQTAPGNEIHAIAADSATCHECLSELFDRSDRRFRYPFINCSDCGPRFTIIRSLPYDRSSTTMSSFEMCRACSGEYEDPADRRFHAQPNACPACGPTLAFESAPGDRVCGEAALKAAVHALKCGKILAVKGLGGFHLTCDATSATAVSLLRRRKQRPDKPFAIMVEDVAAARTYCCVGSGEEAVLNMPSRPIVLLRKIDGCSLPHEIAPRLSEIGVMLPYTPLHHLLTADFGKALIATSGNLSEETIAVDNDDAKARLGKIADAYLFHDREIYSGYDDSLVRMNDRCPIVLRRARGMAPLPIVLPFVSRLPVLACGAHLKNTFALAWGNRCVISQHIGDLDSLDSLNHFNRTLATYEHLFAAHPQLIAHDLHPDYASTTVAKEIAARKNLPIVAVQHHHAHIVSCMVEHGICDRVIGVAFDGIGLGTDDTLWGGEFLLCSLKQFERKAHFRPVPMPGSTQAIRQTWRMALSCLLADGARADEAAAGFIDLLSRRYGRNVTKLVERQIEARVNAPLTTSCGRLFDAVSSVLDVCQIASYEGQAAQELEALVLPEPIDRLASIGSYGVSLATGEGRHIIDSVAVVRAVLSDCLAGVEPSTVSARFHNTICDTIARVCNILRGETGINVVCLSGGVFQNSLLLELTRRTLSRDNFRVYHPLSVPANDGGISLGQAAIALASIGAIEMTGSDLQGAK